MIFCQENLTKPLLWGDNKSVSNILCMAKFGSLAAGALALSVAAGAAEQANAQATELIIPHPEGEIAVDVTRVSLETQADIMTQLQDCLQQGFDFADADGNEKIEGDEQFDWDDERAFCAENAQSELVVADQKAQQAELQGEILVANADQDALRARRDAANAEVQDLTNAAMADIQREGS